MIKNKKQSLIVIGVFVLTLVLFTTTYAFFNYTRTGSGNTIKVGRISFVTKQTETINLTNVFPIDKTTIDTDTDNVDEVVIEIEGDTDYNQGIEYLVSSVDSSVYTSDGVLVPISLDVTTAGLGNDNPNYWTARDSKDTTMYKKLVGDTLVGDQMILVGYIKPNTTSGTKEGINGSITIKAYFDKDIIKISDTYDGTESDNMGTTNEWTEGKTVITTSEWNAIQQNGVSFKVKIEANEGIWVIGSLEEIMRTKNYSTTLDRGIRDNESSEFVSASAGIDFGAISSDTNGKGIYMRAGTENDNYPIMYYRGDISDNNVKFANKCWKIVRTTDTGGVKLMYNGVYSENNKCDNSGASSQITLNISGTDTNNFKFSTDSGAYNSPAYSGYMYGTVYTYNSGAATSGAYFGSSFTWDGTNYKLVDAVTKKNATHHYTCDLGVVDGTCTTLRYYYYGSYYVNLTGGDGIEEALAKMQTNTNNSEAKDKIDTWYTSNMTSYTNKLEDTIWCNDRSFGDGNNNGWIANGGNLSTYLYYGAHERSNLASNTSTVKNQPSLACTNKNDRFTVNAGNGNGALDYPVAMLTEDELVLAGGVAGMETNAYISSGSYYWTLSPFDFYLNRYANEFFVNSSYIIGGYVDSSYGLRPSVSLKPGQPVVRGTGIVEDPYVIE